MSCEMVPSTWLSKAVGDQEDAPITNLTTPIGISLVVLFAVMIPFTHIELLSVLTANAILEFPVAPINEDVPNALPTVLLNILPSPLVTYITLSKVFPTPNITVPLGSFVEQKKVPSSGLYHSVNLSPSINTLSWVLVTVEAKVGIYDVR